jgi:hypothetical protein
MKRPGLFLATMFVLVSLACNLPGSASTPIVIVVTSTAEASASAQPPADSSSPTPVASLATIDPGATFTPLPTFTSTFTFTPLPPPTATFTFTPSPEPAPAGLGTRFVHKATAGNITSNYTDFSNGLTNGDPNAIVMVTANWNPGGAGGTYNTPSVGVWYHSSASKWSIFNENKAAMPLNAAFNVLIPSENIASYVHTSSAGNITGNHTNINNGLTNNNPNAIVFVTANWNPGGGSGVYNTSPLGVWYNASANKWSIFNQDMSAMPAGVSFNVLIPPAHPRVFVHKANGANTISNYTYIDHATTNNNPNAIIFVTANWNPGGGSGVYVKAALGVWYSNSAQKWAIFTQDLSGMPAGASFNVMVFGG